MTTLTQLARDRWHAFFDATSRAGGAQRATVEITGLPLGAQIEADRLPLVGITYEPKDDTLTLIMEGLEHRITHPQAVHAELDGPMLRSLEVIDQDGLHHIAQFTQPLELPAPAVGH